MNKTYSENQDTVRHAREVHELKQENDHLEQENNHLKQVKGLVENPKTKEYAKWVAVIFTFLFLSCFLILSGLYTCAFYNVTVFSDENKLDTVYTEIKKSSEDIATTNPKKQSVQSVLFHVPVYKLGFPILLFIFTIALLRFIVQLSRIDKSDLVLHRSEHERLLVCNELKEYLKQLSALEKSDAMKPVIEHAAQRLYAIPEDSKKTTSTKESSFIFPTNWYRKFFSGKSNTQS